MPIKAAGVTILPYQVNAEIMAAAASDALYALFACLAGGSDCRSD